MEMENSRSMKVFVVDDEPLQLEAMADHLESATSHKVYKFRTGEECIQRMDAVKPDAIVLDYNLNSAVPDAANGLHVLEYVKKHFPSTRVILLSGQESYALAMQTIRSGAEHYVLKGEPQMHDKIVKLLAE
jgi:two-component system response regulator YesN